MKKNITKLLFISTLALIVLGIFFYTRFLQNVRQPLLQKNHVTLNEVSGTFSPIEYAFFLNPIQITYPQVSIAPKNPLYGLVVIQEKLSNKDSLVSASKRILEMELWGSDMNIATGYTSATNLKHWWSKDKTRAYNTWEAGFARYITSMESSIKTLEGISSIESRTGKAFELRELLTSHENKVNQTITTTQKIKADREQLHALSKNVFKSLHQKLQPFLLESDPTILYYPLNEITDAYQTGIYKISIDNPYEEHLPIKQMPILLGGQSVFHEGFITLDKKSRIAKIKIPVFNRVGGAYEKTDIEQSTGKTYYHFHMEQVPEVETYLIRFKHKKIDNTTITITSLSSDAEAVAGTKFSTIIPSTDTAGTSQYLFNLSVKRDDSLTLSVSSVIPIDFGENQLEVLPLIRPQINLEKITSSAPTSSTITYQKTSPYHYRATTTATNYQNDFSLTKDSQNWLITSVTALNNNTYQYNLFYAPIKTFHIILKVGILSVLLFLYSVSSYFRSTIFFFIVKPIRFSFLKVWALISYTPHVVHKVLSPYSKLIYLLLFSLLAGAILFTSETNEVVIVAIALIWIIMSGFFTSLPLMHFHVALALLCTATIVTSFTKDATGDKYAVWGFMFLILGSFQFIIKEEYASLNIKKYAELLHYAAPYFHIVKRAFVVCISVSRSVTKLIDSFVKAFIKRTFVANPKTYFSVLTNTIKGLLLALVLGSVIFALVVGALFALRSANKKIRREQAKQSRLALNPKIYKIEPELIYTGMKVVIFGDNFGWAPQDKIRVKTSRGAIEPEYLSDSKAIFSIPLHWKPGNIQVWVEKPSEWNKHKITVQSDKISIKILPSSGPFSNDDDAFFQQLKYLDEETLKLNGYNK